MVEGGRRGHRENVPVPYTQASVAKFSPKVGSRRTTKNENLVVVIILVALILLPHYMYVVLVLVLLFLLVRER